MSPFCLASALSALLVVRGGDDGHVVGVPAVVQRGDRDADAVAQPRLDVVLEGDALALAAVVEQLLDLRAGVVGAQDLLQRALEVAADLAVGAHDALDVDRARRPGPARPDRRVPPLPLEEPQPAAMAAHSASTRDRTSRRVVFIATHRRRRVRAPAQVGGRVFPPRPTEGTRPGRKPPETARTLAEAAIRTSSCTGSPPSAPRSPTAESPAFWRFRAQREGRGWISVGGNVQVGLRCGGKWGRTPIPDRGGGAPPTPPPRPELLSRHRRIRSRNAHGLPRHLRLQPRREEPAHDPGQVPCFAVGGRRPCQGHRALRPGVDAHRLRGLHRQRAAGRPPALRPGAQAPALLQRQLVRHRPRRRRARDGPHRPARARRRCARRSSSPAPATASRSGIAAAWSDYNAALSDELPDITAAFGHAG